MTGRKMNQEEIIKLIDAYEKNPCLWDISSDAYKRTDIKNKVWNEVAKEMKMDTDFVKKKVKALRGTYTKERNKVNCRKSGQGTEDVYLSNLFWYEKMRFLDRVISKRTTSCNIEMKQEDDSESFASGNNDINHNLSDTAPEKCTKKPLGKDKYLSAIENVLEFTSQSAKRAANDEIDSFCQYLNTSIRKFPEEDALMFMQEIQQNLMNRRLDLVTASKRINIIPKQRIFRPISTSTVPILYHTSGAWGDIISVDLESPNISYQNDATEQYAQYF